MGTLAGENTILIVCRSVNARQALTARLLKLAGR
jgi:arginine repressor